MSSTQEEAIATTCVVCVCCRATFSSALCATSLIALKSMLFDRITGHSVISMPCPKRQRCANAEKETCKEEKQEQRQEQKNSEIMLPLCKCGSQAPSTHERNISASFPIVKRHHHHYPRAEVSDTQKDREEKETDEEKVFFDEVHSIAQTHWICASCMASEYLKTTLPSPLSLAYDSSHQPGSGNSSQTTTTTTETDEDTGYKTFVDVSSARVPSTPSVSALRSDDCCPQCGGEISSLAVAMFLAICEAQYSDYTRMRECWLNECGRNLRLRKLIRDLQYYLLFDESMHGARLLYEKTPQAYCVRVERRVDMPQHLRTNDTPNVEQRTTEVRTAIRPRGSHFGLHELPPFLTYSDRRKRNKAKSDYDWTEPRERLLFEALNLHNDFDEATMPINGDALTSREQRALRRSIRLL